jgi:SAM-dependent methyltransferase
VTPIDAANQKALTVADSRAFEDFVSLVRRVYPWRFEKLSADALNRDYLRVVDHHLKHLVPRASRYIMSDTRKVLDFGCGSGGSAIALALTYPTLTCVGTDIDPEEVTMARARAALYGVADRCEFHCVSPGQVLPFANDTFDFSLCSSVLEYVVELESRRFCVQEMTRLVGLRGFLFFSVPNRLYPFEIHTRKWGWNQFPRLLKAHTVDSSAWEVIRLARPHVLKLHQTPVVDLFRPWSAFCLKREIVVGNDGN